MLNMKHLNLYENKASYVKKLTDYINLNNAVTLIKDEGVKFDGKSNETIVVVKTTEPNEEVIFQFWDNTSSSIISWGDDSIDVLGPHAYSTESGHADDYPRHTYVEPGEYTVILKGNNISSHWMYIDNSLENIFPIQLYKVIQVGKHIKSCNKLFYNKQNLIEINDYAFKYCTCISDFSNCFASCDSLKIVGNNIFANCINATDFSQCFYRCSSLKTIGDNTFVNCKSTISFSKCFSECSSLISIGDNTFANCTNACIFDACFCECYLLSTLSNNTFYNCINADSFYYGFYYSGLSIIPENLFSDCINIKDFGNCFSSCNLLTTIPNNIFVNNINVINFEDCFSNCMKLTTIPSDLFNTCINVLSFQSCFYNCPSINHEYNLTSEDEPKLWERVGLIEYPSFINGSNFASHSSDIFRSSIPASWGGTL